MTRMVTRSTMITVMMETDGSPLLLFLPCHHDDTNIDVQTHSLSPAVEIWHSPDGGVCLPRRRWSSPDEQLPINQQHETAEAPAGPGLAAGPGPAAPGSRDRRVGQSYIDVGGIKVRI